MANRLRAERPDFLVHLIARGVHGDRLFPDASWMKRFESLFAIEAEERNWSVWSYCVMNTHYHAVLSTPDCSLAAGLQRAHARLAHARNRQPTRLGRVIGAPYRTIDIRDNQHLGNCLRYVAMNPVEAGLCTHPADWRLGSFRAIVGIAPCPRWVRRDEVLRFMAKDPGEFTRWVRRDHPVLVPPLAERDWRRYDVERLLLQGRSREEIAGTLGISVRWVERLATRSGLLLRGDVTSSR